MRLTAFLFIITFNIVTWSHQAIAQKFMGGIVATVNEEAISAADLEARLNLAVSSAGLPNTPQVKQSLVPQTLNGLIEEKIKLQDALSNNITVSEEEINLQIETIAQRNQMTNEKFLEKMKEENIPSSTLKAQIESNLAWERLVARRLRPRIEVTFNETQNEIEKIKSNAGKKEIRLAEIFIPFETTQEEGKALKAITQLETQLKQGASFPALANQFSASPSASKNGELGWLLPEDLNEEVLRTAIERLGTRQLSPIVRSKNGFYLFFIIDQRIIQDINETKLIFNLKKIAHKDINALKNVSHIKGCISMDKSYADFPSTQTGDITNLEMGTISRTLEKIIEPLDIAELSPITKEDDLFARYMICRKTYIKNKNELSQEDITNRLGNEQLLLLERRYLTDLRENAFIEIRL